MIWLRNKAMWLRTLVRQFLCPHQPKHRLKIEVAGKIAGSHVAIDGRICWHVCARCGARSLRTWGDWTAADEPGGVV